MEAIAVTHRGAEELCAKEVKALLDCPSKTEASVVLFNTEKLDLCKFTYKSQSSIYVGALLEKFTFKNSEDFEKKSAALKFKLKNWLKKDKTFAVRCENHNELLSSQEIEAQFGELIIEASKKELDFAPKANLNNPDIPFFVYVIENSCYLFIDFAGFDLSSRDYKIYTMSNSIKGTLGYCLVDISGLKDGENLLDLMTNSGVVAIEAAFFLSKTPHNLFRKKNFAFLRIFSEIETFDTLFEKWDKPKEISSKITAADSSFQYVNAAQKNAKIAGINKLIDFSRLDLEWLDIKFDKDSVDRVIAHLPDVSKRKTESEIKKIYQEFFYQLEFVVKSSGSITTLTTKTELLKAAAEKYKLKLASEKELWSGQQKYFALVFKKSEEKVVIIEKETEEKKLKLNLQKSNTYILRKNKPD